MVADSLQESTVTTRMTILLMFLFALLVPSLPQAETWKLESHETPFDYESASIPVDYQPLDHAERPWPFASPSLI